MNRNYFFGALALVFKLVITGQPTFAAEHVSLPFERARGIEWPVPEREYTNDNGLVLVTNTAEPSLEIFRPEESNGTAVVIAPGGALMKHSIEMEGRDVARWLSARGITAAVLKYRLVPTQGEGDVIREEGEAGGPLAFSRHVNAVLPYSIQDGLSAISYLRENAKSLNINPEKIGFMGFSAGGAVTMGVSYFFQKENRPNFVVPIYPWTKMMPVRKPPASAPPMLVICAADDPLDLAPGSINLYNEWVNNGLTAALHMYSRGGHGFGMRKQGLATDTWIERFYEWAIDEGFVARPQPQSPQ